MKLIEKVGSKPESLNSTKTKQFGLFECPVCKEHVEKPLSHGIKNKTCGNRECRKAALQWSAPRVKAPVNPIVIQSTSTSRNKLRYYAAFRLWYNRMDKNLFEKSIDTLEKAADAFYTNYEVLKMQYPNQQVSLSLKDVTKPISKENAYFALISKSTGLTPLGSQIAKLSKSLNISRAHAKAEIGDTVLTDAEYEKVFTKSLYSKYGHSKQTEYLYLIRAGIYTKIGVAKDPEKRLVAISTGCPFKPEIVATKQFGKLCYLVERYLHIQYADKCTNGEWFALDEADVKTIIDTPEDELVMIAAKTINTNKEAYVESTRVYNDESKLSKLRIEAEERYLQTCINYEESKRKAREDNKKPAVETIHEHGDARYEHDRTNQIKATTTHGMSHTELYKAWQTMKKSYDVCADWEEFRGFQEIVTEEFAELEESMLTKRDVPRVYPVNIECPVGPHNYQVQRVKDHEVKSAVAREVLQVKDGVVIAEYGSVTEAAKSVNGLASKISAVCKGKRKTHAGFVWEYKE